MCFNNIFTIFLQYFYNMFTRRVFTILCKCSQGACLQYSMFARRVSYNNFHNVSTNTVSLFLFFFYNIHTREDEGSGLTFISLLQFFYYALSLSASNWGYLYFSLLWQGNSFSSLLGEGG